MGFVPGLRFFVSEPGWSNRYSPTAVDGQRAVGFALEPVNYASDPWASTQPYTEPFIAETDDPAVLRITGTGASSVGLEGVSVGRTVLRIVDAVTGDLVDRIELGVAEIDHGRLEYPDNIYLTDSSCRVSYGLASARVGSVADDRLFAGGPLVESHDGRGVAVIRFPTLPGIAFFDVYGGRGVWPVGMTVVRSADELEIGGLNAPGALNMSVRMIGWLQPTAKVAGREIECVTPTYRVVAGRDVVELNLRSDRVTVSPLHPGDAVIRVLAARIFRDIHVHVTPAAP